MHPLLAVLASLLVVLPVATTSLPAQCANTWQPSGGAAGWNGYASFVTLPNGDLIAGGNFTTAAGVPCNYVARKRGATWAPLGGGMSSPVHNLTVMPNGDLVVCGWFIARWDGAAWSTLGGWGAPQLGNLCTRVAAAPNGFLVATIQVYFLWPGYFFWDEVLQWNGTSWTTLLSTQAPFQTEHITGLVVDPTGNIWIATVVNGGNSVVRRYDNGAWTIVGGSFQHGWITGLALLPNGDVVTLPYLRRWTGTNWTPLVGALNGPAYALTTLPDGDLVIGGSFTSPGANIARRNGTTWSPLGGGPNGAVYGVGFDPEGGVLASGTFSAAGGTAAQNTATFLTNCPATSNTFATGCPTSVGNAQWTVESGPWVGSVYQASCSGLPALSFVIDVIGLQPAPLALDTLLPGAGTPGCTLVPAAELLALRTVGNGRAESRTLIPDLGGLAGFTFYHQMIPFEYDAALNLIGVTGTDTLQMVIGMY